MANVVTTPKDLSEFGRRESMSHIQSARPATSTWAYVVSKKSALELSHAMYGKPTTEELEGLYKTFLEQMEALTNGGA